MNNKILVFFLGFVLFTINLYAQPAPGNPWTFKNCVDYALTHNITIKQSQLNQVTKKFNLKQSRMALLPSLNANASHNFNYGRNIDETSYEYVNQNSESGNYFTGSEVTLFEGFNKIQTIKQNFAEVKAAGYEYQKVKNDITLNLAMAFLQILFYKDQITVANEQLEITGELEKKNRILYEAGNISEGNLLDIQSQIAAEELDLVTKQNQLELSILNMRQLLDLDDLTGFDIKRPELGDPDNINLPSVTDVYYKALENMPEIKGAEENLTASRHALRVAQSSRYPSLSMNGGITSRYFSLAKDLFTGEKVPFNAQFDNNYNQYFGFSLNVKLFNGYMVNHSVSRARIGVMANEYAFFDAKKKLKNNIQNAYADALASFKKYQAAGKSVNALKTVFQYAEKKFAVGAVPSFEYNEIKNRYRKSETEFLQAKYDYVFKLKILDFYSGKEIEMGE